MTANPALAHPTLAPVVDRGVSDLVDRPRLIGEAVARTVIARVAWEGYQAGRADAIGELLTVPEAAAALGIDASQVRRLAAARGLGWQIERGVRLFRPEDVEAMRSRPGRGQYPRQRVT